MRKGKRTARFISVLLVLAMLSSFAVGCNTSSSSGSTDSDGTVLKLGIYNKGYGDAFLYKLAEAFQEKTGITTVVEKSSSYDWITAAIQSGANNNDIDVIFDVTCSWMRKIATKNYVTGYDVCYADLSDIYDTVLEGYSTEMTLKEALLPYSLKGATWGSADGDYGDGNQYVVNWASAIEGIIYNVDLFEKYNLSVPKTTDEFFALLDTMKTLENGTYATNDDGYTIYPFVYSGKVNYLNYIANVWMAQYDGETTFFNMMEGKDANGNYTPSSAKTSGKLSAFTLVANLIDPDNAYCDPNCPSTTFTDAQVLFLAEESFMIVTGDWVEREMETNFDTGMNIAFMAAPVNSDIINLLDSVSTDAELSQVISYLDGDISERPDFVSDEDLAYIQTARSMYNSECNGHIAYIPAYSDNIEAAKEFLLFMMSKEGQEIMLEYCYGNMAPLNIDISEFDQAAYLTPLQTSKYEIVTNFGGATLVGLLQFAPLSYSGGIMPFNTESTLELMFGVTKSSSSYCTPLEALEYNYTWLSSKWSEITATAGVGN